MTIDLSQTLAFVLIMLRMTGVLVFNPIFGRSNIPTMVNAGLAFFLAILLTGTVPTGSVDPNPTLFAFTYMVLKELAVGMIAGFILRMFLSLFVVGGEVIDTQLGISMSKIFDPSSNMSVSLTSSLLNAMFILAFFTTNNHLTLIHLMAQSFTVIPLGVTTFNWEVLYYLPELMSTVFVYAIKLSMPVIVVEVIVTISVGIIMRIIPQINLFVINIQFKLMIGLFTLVVLVPPFFGFCENMIIICFEQIEYVLLNFTG